MRIISLLLALVGLLFGTVVDAKTLYVSSTGNDATTYTANSSTSPWRSIGRALWGSASRSAPNGPEAARAGDVVTVSCGIYDTTGTNTNGFGGVAFSPVNNGTASQPIRIQAAGNAFACIQVRFTSGSGSVIGSVDKSYIHWSGFDLNEVNTPWDVSHGHQSAQVWISGNEAGTTAVGNLVENTRLRGTRTSARDGDNYTVIRLHGTTGTTVRNVHISDVGMTDENSAGILWYFSTDVTVENSLIERCGAGIYMKGMGVPVRSGFYRFRYNRFVDNNKGIQAFTAANATPATPGVIAQNIFQGGQYGVKLLAWGGGDPRNPNDLKFLNNVFVGQTAADSYPFEIRGELATNAGIVIQNNIMVGAGSVAYGYGSDTTVASLQPARLIARHNVYQAFSPSQFAAVGAVLSFAQWQGTYGQDTASPAGMLTAATLFADADYRLAPASPARNQGRSIHGIGGPDGTTIHAGLYITGTEVIGLLGGTGPPPPPPPPPGPVDCIVSAWAFVSATPWGACTAAGEQFRTETWGRSVITPASGGGAACPALTETRTAIQACTPPPPPPPPPPSTGFDARIWGQGAYADGDLRLILRVAPSQTIPPLNTTVMVPINGMPFNGTIAAISRGYYAGGDHRVYVRFDGISADLIHVFVTVP